MMVSKLTSKAQTTIPQAVRTALHLKEGDEIAYSIEDGRVVLTKAAGRAAEDGRGNSEAAGYKLGRRLISTQPQSQ